MFEPLTKALWTPAAVAAVTFGTSVAPAPRAGVPSHTVPSIAQGSTWPAGYSRRRMVTITTGPNSPTNGYNGYTVRVTGFDTATEIAQGDMRADGNDLRVFCWNGTGWVEVPRLVTGLGGGDTHVIFKSQTDIPPNGSDTNHYIFHGNPNAGAPEALSYTNVYLWYDDFSTDPFGGGSPRYTRAKAVDIHGQDYSAPIHDAGNSRVIWDTGDNATSDMYVDNAGFSSFEQDVLIAADHDADLSYPASATDAIVARVSAINTSSTHVYLHYSHFNYPNSPAIAWDTWSNAERNSLGGELRRVFWPFNSPRTWGFATFGTTAKFWDDGDLDPEPWFAEAALLTGSTTTPQLGYMGLAPSQSRGWWDNLIIRRYTEPEPTTALDGEVELTAGVTIAKSVNPPGTATPGIDLTYTVTINSVGNADAVDVVVVDSLAAEVDFQIGSVVNNLPAGIGVIVDYSNDGGSLWTYTPVSLGCGAAAGYDGCVTHIRWRLQDDFPADPPDNSGNVVFVARIR